MQAIQGRTGDGETVGTSLRLPRALREAVRRQADKAGRSINTHIVMVLQEATGAEFGDATPAAGSDQHGSPAE